MLRNVKQNWRTGVLAIVMCIVSYTSAYSQSYKDVTMTVGETKTLYLPSSVTSKNLKSVTFYSNGISYVQVSSYNNYSVTVKAIKAFSSKIIVRCDYRYFVRSGSFTYEATGAYDFRITVVGNGGGTGVKPTSISFPSSAVGISVGESRLLTPTVLPSNAEYTLTWSINNQSVATISQGGLLVGKSAGSADLKVVADNGIYAMLRVVVSKVEPSSVTVTPSSLSITEGESKYLSATVYPSNASQTVSWSSSNSNVASVSSSGKVTAIKAGTATITARTSNGKSSTCVVTCEETIPDLILSDQSGIVNLPPKANVKYERTLRAGWNSVCVPFALTQAMLNAFGERCKIATIERFEIIGRERVVSVKEVESVAAGHPCLIYAPKDVLCDFYLEKVSLKANPDDSSIFKGAYQRIAIGPDYYKLSNDGQSFGVTKSNEAIVGPFRAYIQLSEYDSTRSTEAPLEIKFTQIK